MLGALLLAAAPAVTAADPSPAPPAAGAPVQATTLLDLSGLAWIGGDDFLAGHDGKVPDEAERPRISRLTLTGDARGVVWAPVPVTWPEETGQPSDIESIAAIPGGGFLLAESGDDGSAYHRIFHVVLDADGAATVVEVVDWPVEIGNVEAIAIHPVEDGLLFIYAERADGEASTRIQWAPMTVGPLTWGTFSSVIYPSPYEAGPGERPESDMTVAADGRIFVVSAEDTDDDGPFSSEIWRVGDVVTGGAGSVQLLDAPELVARMDTLKAESITFRVTDDGETLWVGTDDEDYGGILRPLR